MKKIIVILLFVVAGIFIGMGTYFSFQQEESEIIDEVGSSIPFITFLSSNQEEKDSTLDYLDKFITDFDRYSTFSEMDYEKLGGKKSNSCTGKIIMKNNNYVFDSTCQNEHISKKYSINAIGENVKILDDELYTTKDGYFLFGANQDRENSSSKSYQLILLKYDFNGTLQWKKSIDTNPDKRDLTKIKSFDAFPYEVIETESGYSIFYIRSIEEEDINDLFLVKIDKSGNVLSSSNIGTLDYSTVDYVGVYNNQVYLLDYIENTYSLFSIDAEGKRQVKISEPDIDLFYKDSAYDGNSIYGVVQETINSDYMNEEDVSYLKSLQKVNSIGTIEWDFDLQNQLKLKDYNNVSIEVAGQYVFLHVQIVDEKENMIDTIYIFDKQGKFIKKLDSPEELSAINSLDISYHNNFYYINFSENIDYGIGVIKKYDANLQEVTQYSYESAEKTVTIYRNNTFFIYGYLKLKESRYQLVAIYQIP